MGIMQTPALRGGDMPVTAAPFSREPSTCATCSHRGPGYRVCGASAARVHISVEIRKQDKGVLVNGCAVKLRSDSRHLKRVKLTYSF